jgi:hypothetical protein
MNPFDNLFNTQIVAAAFVCWAATRQESKLILLMKNKAMIRVWFEDKTNKVGREAFGACRGLDILLKLRTDCPLACPKPSVCPL